MRTEFRNGLHEFLAPDVFPTEVAHALARAERRNLLLPPQGLILFAGVLTTCPRLFPSLPDLLPRAFAIASPAQIGVYDCIYVALAEREGCPFVTADARLVTTLQPLFPFIQELSPLP